MRFGRPSRVMLSLLYVAQLLVGIVGHRCWGCGAHHEERAVADLCACSAHDSSHDLTHATDARPNRNAADEECGQAGLQVPAEVESRHYDDGRPGRPHDCLACRVLGLAQIQAGRASEVRDELPSVPCSPTTIKVFSPSTLSCYHSRGPPV